MELLYEDSDCIVVAKPPGITVIPGRNEPVEQSLRARMEAERSERLWVVHRIDRDTSGALLFARNEGAHRRLSMAFESREVTKEYLVWTLGVPDRKEGDITVALHAARKGRMRPAAPGEEGALASSTSYQVLSTAGTALGLVARIVARPLTGRQHQIRVHFRAVGAPLLVDPVYSKREGLKSGELGEGAPAVGRLTLHASRLSFPARAGVMTVTAPLPDDLGALDRWLAGPAPKPL